MIEPTVEQHFDGRGPAVREIYDTILTAARELGPVIEDPKKTSIHLNRRSAFAGIQTRRDALILTVKAESDINDPRIDKREQTSPNRWHHEIKLTDVDQIDRQIIGWLGDSYLLSG